MRNTVQRHAIILAALLQVLPVVRNFFANPAAANAFAFILKWGVGSAAVVGTFDACSAASGVVMITSSNIVGTVNTPMTNYLTFSIGGGNTANTASDYFLLNTKVNNTGISSTTLFNNAITNLAMPTGLNFKCLVTNGAATITGLISGIPTTVGTTNISITAGYTGGFTFSTNLQITIAAVSATLPVITNQPVGRTNVAGATTSFSVVAGGNPAPVYQWRLAGSPLAGATNTSLSLTNIRAAQAGSYTVVVTNSAGAVTSTPALLGVTNPLPPKVNFTTITGSQFQFTFNGIPGLTNTVLTNGNLSSGAWNVFTNIPPPANTNPIIINAQPGKPQLFYRLMVTP